MTISLNPELQQFVEEQVRAGKFASPDEAIAEAVRLMKEREEKLVWLRQEIQKGLDDIEHGRIEEWNVRDVEEFIRRRSNGDGKVV